MTFLLLSMVLVGATVMVVRPAMADGARLTLMHFNGKGVLAAFVAVVGAALLLGLEFAVALMLAALVKELGHALGQVLAGLPGARFRLLPLPDRQGQAERAAASDLAAFFILLMGPGLGLAPMVLAFALGEALAEGAPDLAHAARSYALAAGGLNFVALLPVWPLAGGRLARMIVEARFAHLGGLVAAAVSAFVIGLSLTWHSALLFLLGLVGALALVLRPGSGPARPRLTRAQVRVGFAAYFATLAAYFMGGWWVLRLIPTPF